MFARLSELNQAGVTIIAGKHTHEHRPTKAPKRSWVEKGTDTIPAYVKAALRTAMDIEGVPSDEFDDLLWIMAQESEGDVGKPNLTSSGRGL